MKSKSKSEDIRIFVNKAFGYKYVLIRTPSEAFVTFLNKREKKIYSYTFTYTFKEAECNEDFIKGICEKAVLYRVMYREAIESIYV